MVVVVREVLLVVIVSGVCLRLRVTFGLGAG